MKDRTRGIAFTQACIALAKSGNQPHAAPEIAARLYGPDADPTIYLKAAVTGAHMNDSDWGGSIAQAVAREFIGLVNEVSVVGRLQLRRVPLNVSMCGMSAGATAYWRQQAKPAPLTSGVFTSAPLPPLNLDALCVVSKELLDVGDPSAELWIRDELLRATASALDTLFLSDTAAVSDVSPAGILNGVTDLTAHTASVANVAYDLKALIEDFDGDISRSHFVMRPGVAVALQSFEHSNVGANGGEFLGVPVLTTRNAPDEAILLIDGSGIGFGDSGASVSIATQASVEMLDGSLEQDGTTGTGSTTAGMVSLWQINAVGIMVTRLLNWKKFRPCISGLTSIEYRDVSA